MILSKISAYLKERGRAPMSDLSSRFDTDPQALQGMLAHLIAKGRVRRVDPDIGDCGRCGKCDTSQLEAYEWTGPKGA